MSTSTVLPGWAKVQRALWRKRPSPWPGDYRMPVSENWHPKGWLRVSELAAMEPEVLALVELRPEDALEYLSHSESCRAKECAECQAIANRTARDYERLHGRKLKRVILRHKETLVGKEIVERCPWNKSFLVDISGLPLKYVDRYLRWMIGDGTWRQPEYWQPGKGRWVEEGEGRVWVRKSGERNPNEPGAMNCLKCSRPKGTCACEDKLVAAAKKYLRTLDAQARESRDSRDYGPLHEELADRAFSPVGYWTRKQVTVPGEEVCLALMDRRTGERFNVWLQRVVSEFVVAGTSRKVRWPGHGGCPIPADAQFEDLDPQAEDVSLGLTGRMVLGDRWTPRPVEEENAFKLPENRDAKGQLKKAAGYKEACHRVWRIDCRAENLLQRYAAANEKLQEWEKVLVRARVNLGELAGALPRLHGELAQRAEDEDLVRLMKKELKDCLLKEFSKDTEEPGDRRVVNVAAWQKLCQVERMIWQPEYDQGTENRACLVYEGLRDWSAEGVDVQQRRFRYMYQTWLRRRERKHRLYDMECRFRGEATLPPEAEEEPTFEEFLGRWREARERRLLRDTLRKEMRKLRKVGRAMRQYETGRWESGQLNPVNT